MESFQGPLNSCFLGEHLEVNCLEQGLVDKGCFKVEEDEPCLISSLEHSMPFLQMLQSVEYPQLFPLKEPNFQTLIKLQHLKKPWEEGIASIPRWETQSRALLELESCITDHDLVEMQYPPLKSESNINNRHSALVIANVGFECNQEQHKSTEEGANPQSYSWHKGPKTQVATGRERRKRKRKRESKNKGDVERQRMTHIAVERNRRRQMNDHLGLLKSLMPPSYIQRGDHVSIIGGAIDLVKELEQLLQSLEAQKRRRKNEDIGCGGLFELVEAGGYGMSSEAKCGDGTKAERKSKGGVVKVRVIQSHVNLKIECQRRGGQLINAIVALEEELRLTILHLNITSSDTSVLYSFNLKIEEESKIGSASEIAEAVSHIVYI